MNKNEVLNQLDSNYQTFITYLNNLSPTDFAFSFQQKWTAGQQLEHIIRSVKPLVKVFGMPPEMIGQAFGKTNRTNISYVELVNNYQAQLMKGRKAPSIFLPKASNFDQKTENLQTLASLVNALKNRVANFKESELETLQIPHPLMGNISLKEMLYHCIYHVQHHQRQIENHLKKQ